jgi:PPE family
MADPIWFGPPEAVAALLETSDPSTIAANIAAWLAEVIQHELSMGLSVANIVSTLEQWVGLGGAAYGMKGSELNLLGLQPLAAHCLKHVAIGEAAVEADAVARSSVIPSVLCTGNRTEFVADNNINWLVLGALTPRITELEAEYTEYWGQNTSVGVARANVLNTLVGAIGSTPPPITPAGASSGIADAPAQVAQTAAATATQAPSTVGDVAGEVASPAASTGDQLNSMLGPAQGLLSSAIQPFQQVAGLPAQGFQGLSSSIQPLMSAFTSMSPQNAVAAEAGTAEAVSASFGAGGGAAGGLGAGGGGISSGAAGLTSFTRPTSTFEPEMVGGRATGLKPGGVLNAAELRGPTGPAGMGGGPMPMSPATAGMLGREGAGSDKDRVAHARIVVGRDSQMEPQDA